jgi:ribosomal protein S21
MAVMSITSAIVRELMAAGLEGEGLVAALERIEAASQPALTKRQMRDRRYYENHREEKIAKVQARRFSPPQGDGTSDGNDGSILEQDNDGNVGNGDGNDGNPTLVQRSPRYNNSTPKTSLSANAPREGDALGGAPALPTKSKSSRRKPRVIAGETPINPDRKPEDRDREFAAECGLTGKTAWHEWEAFVAYHLKNGSLMVDWHGAWRTWVLRWKMRNEEETANVQQGTRNGRTYPAARPQGTAARVASLMGYEPEPDLHGSEEERRLPDRPSWPEGRNHSRFLDAEPDTAGVYRA